jgi:CRISPR-associated endonuclease/helicase Cas3
VKEPVCIVCGCDEPDEASGKIYGDWILMRTRELLPDNISLPGDISPLVQETYRDMAEGEELYRLWMEQMERQKDKERKATSHRILAEKDLEDTMHGLLDHTLGDRESDALARVRDGESSISVLLMVHTEADYAEFVPWQSQGERFSMDHVPSEDECRRILLQKVQLPRILSVYRYDQCVAELEKRNRDYLSEWQNSRWLHGELILLLDENLEAELCGYTLTYHNQDGLICEKEG